MLDDLERLVNAYDVTPDLSIGAMIQGICEDLQEMSKEEIERYNGLVQKFPWVFDEVGWGEK